MCDFCKRIGGISTVHTSSKNVAQDDRRQHKLAHVGTSAHKQAQGRTSARKHAQGKPMEPTMVSDLSIKHTTRFETYTAQGNAQGAEHTNWCSASKCVHASSAMPQAGTKEHKHAQVRTSRHKRAQRRTKAHKRAYYLLSFCNK